jgi:hypothetical protein
MHFSAVIRPLRADFFRAEELLEEEETEEEEDSRIESGITVSISSRHCRIASSRIALTAMMVLIIEISSMI